MSSRAGNETVPPKRRLPPGIAALARDAVVWGALTLAFLTLITALTRTSPTSYSATTESAPPRVVLRGFHATERNGADAYRWSFPDASLELPLNGPGEYEIALTLQGAGTGEDRPTNLYLGGRPIATLRPDGTPREYRLRYDLPPDRWALTDGDVVTIELQTAPYRPPGDARALGVVLRSVEVRALRAATPWQPGLFATVGLVIASACIACRRSGLRFGATAVVAGAGLLLVALALLTGRGTVLRFILRLSQFPLLVLLGCAALVATAQLARWWPGLGAARRQQALLALLLLLTYGYFLQPGGWNELSRNDLVRALVDDRTVRIDRYQANTEDKALLDGHYYSDKPPGSAFVAAPAYALVRAATRASALPRLAPAREDQVITYAAAIVPSVTLAVLLLAFLQHHLPAWWALTATAGYALGTMAFPFATLHFGHALAASCLFAAFFLLWCGAARGWRWVALAAGCLAGWAVLAEYPAILGAGALAVYALALHGRRAPLFAAGGVPPALLLGWYNWAAFGNPLALGYSHLADDYFASSMSRGILGVTWPKLPVLLDLLASGRGLLVLSPWLVAAPLGLWVALRHGPRREGLLCGGLAALFLLYNAGYYLPFGGESPGPRFLLPALPFIAVLAALAPRLVRPLLIPAILYSIVV